MLQGFFHTKVFFPIDNMNILDYLWVLVFHLGLCASFTTLRNIYIALAGSLHFQGWGALIILLRTSSGHVPITQTVKLSCLSGTSDQPCWLAEA